MAKKPPADATPADIVKRLMKAGKLKRKCCRSKPRCRKCPVLALQRTKDASQLTRSAPVLLTAAQPVKDRKDRGGHLVLAHALVAESTKPGRKPDKKAAKKIAKQLRKGKRPTLARSLTRTGKKAA